jgi:hypothetical protein
VSSSKLSVTSSSKGYSGVGGGPPWTRTTYLRGKRPRELRLKLARIRDPEALQPVLCGIQLALIL